MAEVSVRCVIVCYNLMSVTFIDGERFAVKVSLATATLRKYGISTIIFSFSLIEYFLCTRVCSNLVDKNPDLISPFQFVLRYI